MEQIALKQAAEALGFDHAEVVEVARVRFEPAFRKACADNMCGKYGRCWTCPPDVGEIEALIAQAKGYRWMLVFQSIGQLEDSYDFEGMMAAGKRHNDLTRLLRARLGPAFGASFLPLGAGGCSLCEACTKPEDLPCRHPEEAIGSLEAYGVAVSELAGICGMKYINGTNTVTYFGAFLYG